MLLALSLTVIIRIVIGLWCCRNNINIIKVRRCSCFHNGNFPFWRSGCGSGVIVLVKSFLATVGVFLWQKWRDFQLWWSSGTAAAERTVLTNYIVIRQTANISFRNHIIPQFDILIKSWTIIRLLTSLWHNFITQLIRTLRCLNNHYSNRSWIIV